MLKDQNEESERWVAGWASIRNPSMCDAVLRNAPPQMGGNFTLSMINLRNRYASSQMTKWVTECGSLTAMSRRELVERSRCRCRRLGDMTSTKMLVHKMGSARAMARQ